MSSVKTFIINDNGEYRIKEHVVKDKFQLKNTLEQKKMQMKMAHLAKMKKEQEKNNIQVKNVPEVVNVKYYQKVDEQPIKLEGECFPLKVKQRKVQETLIQSQNVPPMVSQQILQKQQLKNEEELKKKIEKESDVILKANGKETKEDEKQRVLLQQICGIIGIQGHPHGKSVSFDTLNDPHVIKQLFSLQDILKEVFPSSKLTALHSNAIDKQQFPGVNIVRQIFKEMGYKMRPINISDGYLGSKKLLRREYQFLKL